MERMRGQLTYFDYLRELRNAVLSQEKPIQPVKVFNGETRVLLKVIDNPLPFELCPKMRIDRRQQ